MKNISIVMIASNEEKMIVRSLEAVKWAPEVIVVIDENSSDLTEQLARNSGAKVIKHPWEGYATQKNYGIKKSTQEWVLSVDADEVVSPALAQEIISLKPFKDGYLFPFRNYLGNKWLKHGGLYPDYHLRLFRKNLGQFRGISGGEVHETVQINNVGKLRGAVDHYTYSSIGDFWQRVRRYSYTEGKELSKLGIKPSMLEWVKIPLRFIKIYIFQLGLIDGWYGLINAVFLSAYQFLKIRSWSEK